MGGSEWNSFAAEHPSRLTASPDFPTASLTVTALLESIYFGPSLFHRDRTEWNEQVKQGTEIFLAYYRAACLVLGSFQVLYNAVGRHGNTKASWTELLPQGKDECTSLKNRASIPHWL